MRFIKTFLISLFFLASAAASVRAQAVELVVDVPTMVGQGRRFLIEYSSNKRPDRFIVPDLTGFNVIAGPSESQKWDLQFDGRTTHRVEKYAVSYVLVAGEPGIYTVPTAKIEVDGKQYESKPVSFEVVAEQSQGQGGGQGSQGGQGQSPSGQGSGQGERPRNEIASEDLLVRAIVDKTSVFKGEPVRVYFKIYSRVNLEGFQSQKAPAFNGFWVHQLSADHYQWQNENYNNRVYRSRVISDYLLYPQQAGQLTIEQMEITAVAQMMVQNQSRGGGWDDIFNSLPELVQISKKITSAPVRINVKEWPEGAPESFAGAVGDFTMSTEFPTENLATNSASNYVIRIAGTGNLPLVQAPRLDLPSSFEQYNVKTTENLSRTSSGISGSRQFEYPIIPRAEGEFYIEPVRFSYFNPQAGRYFTLSSNELQLNILPDSTGAALSLGGAGLVTGISREDVRLLDEDIRFIKFGSGNLALQAGSFMGSTLYFVILLVIFAGFAFALVYLQKRIKQMQNMDVVRGKRANKVALQRLRAAEGYMKEGNARSFYEEMLKALWGYMGDKLNIPAAMLTKEHVREELLKRGIQAEYVSRYTELITDCEYAQYSPSGSGHMTEIYSNAVKAISRFESLIRKKK